jgi:hypothetical protein
MIPNFFIHKLHLPVFEYDDEIEGCPPFSSRPDRSHCGCEALSEEEEEAAAAPAREEAIEYGEKLPRKRCRPGLMRLNR